MTVMAVRGRKLDRDLGRAAAKLAGEVSIRYASRALNLDRKTVRRYLKSSRSEQAAGRQGQPPAQEQKAERHG
jgi:hypothetical protein